MANPSYLSQVTIAIVAVTLVYCCSRTIHLPGLVARTVAEAGWAGTAESATVITLTVDREVLSNCFHLPRSLDSLTKIDCHWLRQLRDCSGILYCFDCCLSYWILKPTNFAVKLGTDSVEGPRVVEFTVVDYCFTIAFCSSLFLRIHESHWVYSGYYERCLWFLAWRQLRRMAHLSCLISMVTWWCFFLRSIHPCYSAHFLHQISRKHYWLYLY